MNDLRLTRIHGLVLNIRPIMNELINNHDKHVIKTVKKAHRNTRSQAVTGI